MHKTNARVSNVYPSSDMKSIKTGQWGNRLTGIKSRREILIGEIHRRLVRQIPRLVRVGAGRVPIPSRHPIHVDAQHPVAVVGVLTLLPDAVRLGRQVAALDQRGGRGGERTEPGADGRDGAVAIHARRGILLAAYGGAGTLGGFYRAPAGMGGGGARLGWGASGDFGVGGEQREDELLSVDEVDVDGVSVDSFEGPAGAKMIVVLFEG